MGATGRVTTSPDNPTKRLDFEHGYLTGHYHRAWPVPLPLPIIPGVNASAHHFGGFGLNTAGSAIDNRDSGANASEFVEWWD